MTPDELNVFFDTLRNAGWHVETSNAGSNSLPESIASRYPNLPADYLQFLEQFTVCSNKAEDAWFLSLEDFKADGETRVNEEIFRWNEWELTSLECAEGDEDLIAEIRRFWDQHFPIALAVHSEYAYLGICLSEEDYGAVVYGFNPYYEEPSRVCGSFHDYLITFSAIVRGEQFAYVKDAAGQQLWMREYSDFL